MEEITKYISENGGYARLTELREEGFQIRDISKLNEDGVLYKVKPGLYKLKDSQITSGYVDVSKAMPMGVIALVSALSYYDLTTFNPSGIHVAIPNHEKPKKLNYPPVEVYYFRKNQYESGIEEISVQGHTVRMYSMEKTVCDMFRYRNKLGEDLALEGLREYLELPGANLKILMEYMNSCRVRTIMEPYVTAMVSG